MKIIFVIFVLISSSACQLTNNGEVVNLGFGSSFTIYNCENRISMYKDGVIEDGECVSP